jgi:hypothetical protein
VHRRIDAKKPWPSRCHRKFQDGARLSALPDGAGGTSARLAVLSALVQGGITGSMKDEISGGFQHTQDCCGAAKEVEPTVVGGDLLIGSGAGTEEVAQLVVGAQNSPADRGHLNPRIGP